jgi:acetoacetyl-CoA synthetase
MKVEVYNDLGESLIDEVGELVCTAPCPSMPINFLNDPDGSKYKKAYFTAFPNVWRHGDYIKITSHGSVIVLGRSDATLNPGGVRIGTAEICNPVEAMTEINDTLAVSQRWQGDSRIILFVVLQPGLELSEALQGKIRNVISKAATARHVPAVIYQVDDIPRTLNGKKVELAVTRLLHGETVSNLEALANPEVLKQFKNILQLT